MMNAVLPLTLATALVVAVAPATAETLADALARAYRTNPTLGSSRYDVRQADEGVAQARAELRPTLDFQAYAAVDHRVESRLSRRNNPFSSPVTTTNSDTMQLSLAQPLFTGGRATADRRSAEAQVGVARQALRGAEGDLLLAVINAYVNVRETAASLDVRRGSVSELDKIQREVEARRVAGELTLTDVAQAQAQFESAREQVIVSEEQLEAARADYAALTGREPDLLAEEPALPRLPRNVDAAFAHAEQHSPELARALFAERASQADITSARAAGAPTLSFRETGTLSGAVSPYRFADQDRELSGSLVLSVPLSAGGRIASQVRQAEDRNGQARLQIEVARRRMVQDVRNAWNAAVTADRAAEVIEARSRSATVQLDGMLQEYRVGLRSTFDVLYAQQSVRDAQISLLGAVRDRYVAEATLLRRVGDLEVDTIMTAVPVHDPVPHAREAETRNLVPWEGALASIDAALAPHTSIRPIQQPAPAVDPAVRFASPMPTSRPLARTSPATPILGAAGIPALRSQP
jgi:outer membrane protein